MNYNNFAQRTNFIAGSDKFDNLPFFLTNVNVPGINFNHPEVGGRAGALMKLPGDTMTFNTLSLEMLIDEDFLIYQELMDIINANIDIENGTFNDFYFDFFVEINNSKGHKVLKIDFTNCRIESIGDVQLDTTDETTEYTLALELTYDYHQIEATQVAPTSIDDPEPEIPEVPIVGQTYTEEFTDLTEWVLWGYPTPVITPDAGAVNGFGFDSNGAGLYESGGVQNNIEIPVVNPFEFTFRIKQPLSGDADDGYYLNFGITEGIGIETTSNGRTGSTVCGVFIDGGNKKGDSTIKQISYQFRTSEDESEANHSNDGAYHEFKFVYTPGSSSALYSIYKDGNLAASLTNKLSRHEFLYLFIQGKSEEGIQIVDSINGTYGEV